MYHLAKGLYRYATSKEEYSVLILGLDNAGKSTLQENVKALFDPSNPEPKLKTVPTVGQNVTTITLPDTVSASSGKATTPLVTQSSS
jgi:ADP-ribosylation factor related protein 1